MKTFRDLVEVFFSLPVAVGIGAETPIEIQQARDDAREKEKEREYLARRVWKKGVLDLERLDK